ncbi:hypothetical protein LTR37_012153 [Vermiconidia calcicola]|uniref:Uncharacterized protein n=1 Tax=Vermiconidia calcicola TaxID=1690605 RepID=A0ACC3N2R2_9PEZI|nr:hypothetical protein LTR37_012153 [Vermiconidia calcicola]
MTGPYVIRKSVNGEGNGLFATRDIRTGETVVEKRPLVVIDLNQGRFLPDGSLSLARIYDEWNRQLSDPKERKDYLKLSHHDNDAQLAQNRKDTLTSNPDAGKVIAIWNNNCLGTGSHDLYSKISCRINHSCQKNATWGGNGEGFTVRAIRNIKKDEEVLISYISLAQPRKMRSDQLRQGYGFDCDCPACGKEFDQLSDDRRKVMCSLNQKLPKVVEAAKLEKFDKVVRPEHVKLCEDMVGWLKQEPTMIDEMFVKQELLAHLYRIEKKHSTASSMMQQAYEGARLCRGDGDEHTERIKYALQGLESRLQS